MSQYEIDLESLTKRFAEAAMASSRTLALLAEDASLLAKQQEETIKLAKELALQLAAGKTDTSNPSN